MACHWPVYEIPRYQNAGEQEPEGRAMQELGEDVDGLMYKDVQEGLHVTCHSCGYKLELWWIWPKPLHKRAG